MLYENTGFENNFNELPSQRACKYYQKLLEEYKNDEAMLKQIKFAWARCRHSSISARGDGNISEGSGGITNV